MKNHSINGTRQPFIVWELKKSSKKVDIQQKRSEPAYNSVQTFFYRLKK